MTITAKEQVGIRQGQPGRQAMTTSELAIQVDMDPGSRVWRIRFSVQDQPAVRRPQGATSMRVYVPTDVIPADESQLARLVSASDLDALPPSVLMSVTAQFSADLATSDPRSVVLFSRESRWAGIVAAAIEDLTGHRPTVTQLDRARRAQIARIVDQYSGDLRLNPDTIAAALGVSRRTVYLAAESLGGVAEYLRSVRVWRAIARIEDPDDDATLESIARDCGFSSPRRLCRSVQSELGINPASLRAQVRRRSN